jgi:hypothetical protein
MATGAGPPRGRDGTVVDVFGLLNKAVSHA